jgi:hypothetical protein
VRLAKIAIDGPSFGAVMAREDRQQTMLPVTKDHQGAIPVFVENRSPVYRGE